MAIMVSLLYLVEFIQLLLQAISFLAMLLAITLSLCFQLFNLLQFSLQLADLCSLLCIDLLVVLLDLLLFSL